jgi:hypothetical protein
MRILVILCMLLTQFLLAQGNLQFNQVRMITFNDGVQTVPAGKVWKIESVFSDGSDSYPISSSGSSTSIFSGCGLSSVYLQYYGRYICINGIPISFGILSGSTMTPLPFWVPGGSSICLGASSTYSAKGYNVIEFNVVP